MQRVDTTAALGVTPGIEGEKQKARRSPGKDLRVSSKRDTKRAAKLLLLRAQILKQHPCGCGSQQNVHGKERKTGVWSGKWNKGCRRGFGSDSRKKLCLFVSGGHFGNGWSVGGECGVESEGGVCCRRSGCKGVELCGRLVGLTLSVILGVRVGIGDVGWVGLQNGFVEWVFVF